jgi:hypothetical protein
MLHALSKTGASRVAMCRDGMVQSLAEGSWQFAHGELHGEYEPGADRRRQDCLIVAP